MEDLHEPETTDRQRESHFHRLNIVMKEARCLDHICDLHMLGTSGHVHRACSLQVRRSRGKHLIWHTSCGS